MAAARRLLPKYVRKRIMGYLKKINDVHAVRLPMDYDLKKWLVQNFEGEIRRLSGLIGRDLTSWTKI